MVAVTSFPPLLQSNRSRQYQPRAANTHSNSPQIASVTVVTPSPRGAGASVAATNAFAAHRLPSPAAPLPAPKAATSSATATSAGPVQVGADTPSPRGVAADGSFQSSRGRKKLSAAQPLRTPSALARLPLPASSAATSFAASAPSAASVASAPSAASVTSAASASSASSIPVGASSISPSTCCASPSAASASPAANSPGASQPAENSRNASPETTSTAPPAQVAQVGSAAASPAATPSDCEWLTEVSVLAHLSHPNLISLVGYCVHHHHRMLVYPSHPPVPLPPVSFLLPVPLPLPESSSSSSPLPLSLHLSPVSLLSLFPSLQGEREWLTEVSVLAHLSHPNLISLVGYCTHHHHRMLIYPYLPNGFLERKLFRLPAKETPLTWQQRIGIEVGAAKGLAYLHEEMDKP
ncbi:unnamed protein product, partial [Closterium sp. Yama58-4]